MRIKIAGRGGTRSGPPLKRSRLRETGRLGGRLAEARRVFQSFMALEQSYDPALADLYCDHAKIIISRKTQHGFETRQEFTGRQWKERLISMLPKAQVMEDSSLYSNIEFRMIAAGIKVSAFRYSGLHDYTDHGYYLILAQRGQGLRIIEESAQNV